MDMGESTQPVGQDHIVEADRRGRQSAAKPLAALRTGLGSQRYLQLFEKLSPLIGNQDTAQIAMRACELIAEMLDVAACSIFLLDESQTGLTLTASTHIPQNDWPNVILPIHSVCGKVLQANQSLLINGRSAFKRQFGREPVERYLTPSCAIVPLPIHARAAGVINMAHPIGRRAFRMRDVELLEAAANLIGGAFATAMRYHETAELKENLIDIFDSLHVAIIAIDGRGRVTSTNGRTRRLLGLNEKEVWHKQIGEVLPASIYQIVRRLLQEAVSEEEPAQEQLNLELGGTQRLVEITVSRLGSAFGGSLIMFDDVTRDEEVKRLREAESAKRSFLSIISHELRTPLAVIRGALPLIDPNDGRTVVPETLRQVHGILLKNSVRLSEVVNAILDVTEIENGTLKLALRPTDLRELIDEIIGVHAEAAIHKQLRWSSRFSQESIVIPADRRRLRQVLSEMVHNAIKFSNPGGEIEIRATVEAPWIEILLTNSGIRIEPETRKGIFEKFYQCNSTNTRTQGGCGLGLFLAQNIVRLHGGRIELLESIDNLTTFRILLPQEVGLETPAPSGNGCCPPVVAPPAGAALSKP